MNEKIQLETVEALIETIGKALEEQDIDGVRKACAQLGPHALTLERELVACRASDSAVEAIPAAGTAVISAGRTAPNEAIGVLPIEQAAVAASALQMDTATIAERIEEVLQIADARCKMDVVKRITEWLTKEPEFGLVVADPRPPATWRPVRTWRLREVYPETAEAWTQSARKLMKDARMRGAVT